MSLNHTEYHNKEIVWIGHVQLKQIQNKGFSQIPLKHTDSRKCKNWCLKVFLFCSLIVEKLIFMNKIIKDLLNSDSKNIEDIKICDGLSIKIILRKYFLDSFA